MGNPKFYRISASIDLKMDENTGKYEVYMHWTKVTKAKKAAFWLVSVPPWPWFTLETEKVRMHLHTSYHVCKQANRYDRKE